MKVIGKKKKTVFNFTELIQYMSRDQITMKALRKNSCVKGFVVCCFTCFTVSQYGPGYLMPKLNSFNDSYSIIMICKQFCYLETILIKHNNHLKIDFIFCCSISDLKANELI